MKRRVALFPILVLLAAACADREDAAPASVPAAEAEAEPDRDPAEKPKGEDRRLRRGSGATGVPQASATSAPLEERSADEAAPPAAPAAGEPGDGFPQPETATPSPAPPPAANAPRKRPGPKQGRKFAPQDLEGGDFGGLGARDKEFKERAASEASLGRRDQTRRPGAMATGKTDKPDDTITDDGLIAGQRCPDGKDCGIIAATPPADMYFKHYGVNPTIDTAEQPSSTFAIDVDAASYSVARSYLSRGTLPAEAAVRVEEFVNAFDYGYEAVPGKTFTISAEAAPSPNRRGYHVLHVGIKGREVSHAERQPANLVFVIDVSGSMEADNRLGLVKRSLRLLVDQLGEADKVGIVTYGSVAREVLEPTSAYRRGDIIAAVDGLRTEGATNAEAGLRVGYSMAAKHFREGAINRVVLCSDGVANVGNTGPAGILDTIGREVERGITMTTIGFGMGNYNDTLMEQLADKGNGNYYYVDKLDEARKVFVDNLTGTLQVIAKDVKIQLAFDTESVLRYRLIGYENRALSARDFDDDRVDAGEIGAGHSVTAIYEIKLREDAAGDIGKLRLRFKEPSGGVSTLLQKTLPRSIVKHEAGELSSPTQLSLIAAQFGEKLRGSYWARNVSYEDMLARFDRVAPALRSRADVVELRGLIEKAKGLDQRGDRFVDEAGPIARMDFDRVPVLR